jgi:ribonuclease HI
MTAEYVIHTDGASRGNPGPAAYAYVIERPDEPDVEAKGYLGKTTNNIAEYTGLVRALEHAHKLGARRLLIHSDSELIVNQMNGSYKVRHPQLVPLYDEACTLRRAFEHVTVRHIRREQNKRADLLCNEALDAAADGTAPSVATPARAQTAIAHDPMRHDLESRVREDALTCLRAGAEAWAQGRDGTLKPEHVWEQIWSILLEAGVLKRKK